MNDKIHPGGGTVECFYKTPLVDLLRGVPKDGRVMYERNPMEHQNIPYGPMCHDAADEIERLTNERDWWKSEFERLSEHYRNDISDFTVEISQKEAALSEVKVWLENKTIELDAVTRERDELNKLCTYHENNGVAIVEQLAACQRDADRYRWLRVQHADVKKQIVYAGGTYFDSVVDQAMKEQRT
jgi:hypothetical protein